MITVYESMPGQRYARYEKAKSEMLDICEKNKLAHVDAIALFSSLSSYLIRRSFIEEDK